MAIQKSPPKVYELTISLADVEPVVWRKVLVHDFIELDQLHLFIQIVMGWSDNHLYSFDIGNKSYSDKTSAEEMKNTYVAEGAILGDVLGKHKNFSYVYDFGDGWLHEIKITKTLETDPRMRYPVCIGGENACPPEDCGGAPGFERLKSVISGKDCQEKDELITWLGGYYNPYTFDPNFVNHYLIWIKNDSED
jgi:hypothetical protein